MGFVFRYFLERFETYDVKKLGAVLVVPLASTLLGFLSHFGPNRWIAYTVGLVLGLVLYQAFYAKFPAVLPFRHGRAGLLTRTEVTDILKISDATGTVAAWTRTQTMRFHKDAKSVLISKTGGDGRIVPVSITSPDGTVAFSVRKNHIYAEFTTDIRKGASVTITLECTVRDSFPDKLEAFEHAVLQNTDKLTIEIHFPDSRRCQAAELIKVFGADEDRIEGLSPSGNVVRRTIPVEMHIAESYRVSWNW